MRTLFIVLGCAEAALALYNMSRQQTEATRFAIIICGIFTILQKLYS